MMISFRSIVLIFSIGALVAGATQGNNTGLAHAQPKPSTRTPRPAKATPTPTPVLITPMDEGEYIATIVDLDNRITNGAAKCADIVNRGFENPAIKRKESWSSELLDAFVNTGTAIREILEISPPSRYAHAHVYYLRMAWRIERALNEIPKDLDDNDYKRFGQHVHEINVAMGDAARARGILPGS